jgi:ABC-type multidrug transport system fused ATPase/permease subunit
MHALDELRRGLIRPVALAGALSAAAMGLVYVYTVWLAVRGHLSVGDVVLYGGAVTLLQAELGALARAAGYLPQELRFLPSVFRVLEALPDLPRAQMPRPAPRPIRWGIVFGHVGFTYPGAAGESPKGPHWSSSWRGCTTPTRRTSRSWSCATGEGR